MPVVKIKSNANKPKANLAPPKQTSTVSKVDTSHSSSHQITKSPLIGRGGIGKAKVKAVVKKKNVKAPEEPVAHVTPCVQKIQVARDKTIHRDFWNYYTGDEEYKTDFFLRFRHEFTNL